MALGTGFHVRVTRALPAAAESPSGTPGIGGTGVAVTTADAAEEPAMFRAITEYPYVVPLVSPESVNAEPLGLATTSPSRRTS